MFISSLKSILRIPAKVFQDIFNSMQAKLSESFDYKFGLYVDFMNNTPQTDLSKNINEFYEILRNDLIEPDNRLKLEISLVEVFILYSLIVFIVIL